MCWHNIMCKYQCQAYQECLIKISSSTSYWKQKNFLGSSNLAITFRPKPLLYPNRGCCLEQDVKPLLIFGVREGVVVHAVIIPVGFIAPWHPVIVVVRFDTYKALSVKKEMNKKRKKMHLGPHPIMLSYSPHEQLLVAGVIHCCCYLLSCCSLLVVVWIM